MKNKPKITEVREYDWGVYVWYGSRGILQDEEGNILSLEARRDNPIAIKAMYDYVHDVLNIKEGKPVFLQGRRQISQSEWEDEMERLQAGKDPDPITELARREKGEQV